MTHLKIIERDVRIRSRCGKFCNQRTCHADCDFVKEISVGEIANSFAALKQNLWVQKFTGDCQQV